MALTKKQRRIIASKPNRPELDDLYCRYSDGNGTPEESYYYDQCFNKIRKQQREGKLEEELLRQEYGKEFKWERPQPARRITR